ncbi:MAG: glycosyltransferase family 2 protein, partial [Gemmobacter sp.]
MARNPGDFARLWLGHYGRAFGAENCFLILDGADQALPEGTGANILRLPHRALSREAGDRRRAGIVSDMAAALFAAYDVVVATDIDEMLILDPAAGADLGAHLMG